MERTGEKIELPNGEKIELKQMLETIRKELISPNGDLKVGHDIAEWDEAPSPSEVKQKIDGKSYEERSGRLLTDHLQVAR